MKEFKVGDKVVREDFADKGPSFNTGEVLTVVYVSEDGAIAVKREGEADTVGYFPDDVTRNCWNQHNFKLKED